MDDKRETTASRRPRWWLAALALVATVGLIVDAWLPTPVVTVRDVVYGEACDADGARRPLYLDIDQPAARSKDRRPVVVYIHGGSYRLFDHHARVNLRFAARGYFCVSVGYRLSQEALWPAQIYDCKAAIRWIRANADRYGLDPDRIGVWGDSAGGHLAALLGTSGDVPALEGNSGNPGYSSRVACVVDLYGPVNLLDQADTPGFEDMAAPTSFGSQLFGRPVREAPDLCAQFDPRTYVTAQCPPFLIQHGDRDRLVAFQQSVALRDSLRKAGVDVEFTRVRGAGHVFAGASEATARALTRQIIRFFDTHLRANGC